MPVLRTFCWTMALGWTAAAIVMLPAAVGCAPAVKKSGGSPFASKKSSNEPVGIKTAAKTIEELKTVREQAKTLPPAEQQRYVQEMKQRLPQEQDPLVRMQIMDTLAEFPGPEAVAVMQAGMADSSPEVRIAGCKALGRRKGPDAVKELTRVLQSDTDIDVRIAATRALGETGDQAAVATLGEALNDSDPALQYRAVQSLKSISGRDYGSDMNAWKAYAKDTRNTPPPTIADRFRNLFR